MSLNEFVLAFVGVVIGLGVADLLTSFHKLLRAGSRVRWDWLTLAYATMMLYSLVVFWWWQFDYPATPTLTIAGFLPQFVFLVLTFLMVASALPDEVPAEGIIDLRDYYLRSRRHRWSLVLISLVIPIILSSYAAVRAGDYADILWNGLPLVSAILAGLAIRYEAIWLQALAIAWITTLTSYFNLFVEIGR